MSFIAPDRRFFDELKLLLSSLLYQFLFPPFPLPLRMEEAVTCGVCLEFYKDPRSLPCGHTFCFRCICGWHKGASLVCPLCMSEALGTPTALPKNFTVQEVLDSFHQQSAVATVAPQSEKIGRAHV